MLCHISTNSSHFLTDLSGKFGFGVFMSNLYFPKFSRCFGTMAMAIREWLAPGMQLRAMHGQSL